jgi:hypothetical protein
MLRTLAQRSFAACLCFVVACGGRAGRAATLPDGRTIAIIVDADRGLNGADEARRAELNQLGNYMEGDLLATLLKSGYDPARATDAAAQPGPGRYVLETQIVRYDSGSAAARVWMGFGASVAAIHAHYALIGPDSSVYTAGDLRVGSGADWRKAAHELNLRTVQAVNARLRQSL